jgi:hypothetical protein
LIAANFVEGIFIFLLFQAMPCNQEIQFFFPDFDQKGFFNQEEPLLRTGQIVFDPEGYVHRVQQLPISSQNQLAANGGPS